MSARTSDSRASRTIIGSTRRSPRIAVRRPSSSSSSRAVGSRKPTTRAASTSRRRAGFCTWRSRRSGWSWRSGGRPRMRSVRVYGGLPGPRAKKPGDLVLDPATPPQGSGKAAVKLHELTRKMVSDLPARFIDLLEIASYVYSADQFTPRDTVMMPDMGSGWRRSFEFQVAVRDVAFWTREDVQNQLASTLGFLSDDTYDFTFSK